MRVPCPAARTTTWISEFIRVRESALQFRGQPRNYAREGIFGSGVTDRQSGGCRCLRISA